MLEGAAESPWLCQFTEIFASLLPDSRKRHDSRQHMGSFLFSDFPNICSTIRIQKFVSILEVLGTHK